MIHLTVVRANEQSGGTPDSLTQTEAWLPGQETLYSISHNRVAVTNIVIDSSPDFLRSSADCCLAGPFSEECRFVGADSGRKRKHRPRAKILGENLSRDQEQLSTGPWDAKKKNWAK